MKTRLDPRHLKRIKIMQDLYAWGFHPTQALQTDSTPEIIKSLGRLDKLIVKAAPAWPLNKINRVDLAILRLAVFELIKGETPPKVVIDEAVELGKRFGGESTASFVNGVLGKLISLQKIEV